MKPELKNLKEYTHKTSLTAEEKLDMFQNIQAYANTHPAHSRYFFFAKYSIAYASMFALLIGTSATSLAAEGALPGDILYPIKTNLNEKVAQTLTFSKKQKTQVTVNLVDKRMGELEKMIIENKDTPEKINIVVQKLDEHKEDIETIQKSETEEESKESAQTYVELESMVDTHIEILEDIIEDKKLKKEVVDLIKENTEDSQDTEELETATSTEELETATSAEIIKTEEDTTSIEDKDLILEAKKFSTGVDSIINSAKSKSSSTSTDEATSTKIKEDIRRQIIEKAEEELDVEIQEEIDSKIKLD